MTEFKKHRNITFRRMVLDCHQFFRSQSAVTALLGRQYKRSRRFIEMDITYRCNLHCLNCNRSCNQAPTEDHMTVEQIKDFARESAEKGAKWERIRLLGGEPTLHPEILEILEVLLAFKRNHRPHLHIEVGTNGCGRKVNDTLKKLPKGVAVKNTLKRSNKNLFRPFNLAPVDRAIYKWADYSYGCRIISDCGIGLTPYGYYPCAIAGGIDRVFGFGLGKRGLPDSDDDMGDQLQVFCQLCGHFGFALPTKKRRVSRSWREAYSNIAMLSAEANLSEPESQRPTKTPRSVP